MNTENNYQIQAEDLRLYVFNRSIHPELYVAHRRRHLADIGYEADMAIVGPGHVIGFRAAGQTFSEVMLPSGHRMPRLGKRHDFRLMGGPQRIELNEDVVYSCQATAATLDPEKFKEIHEEHAMCDTLNSIKFFWAGETREGLVPFSLVEFWPGPFGFDVNSFHSFPASRTVIKTESRFEVEM